MKKKIFPSLFAVIAVLIASGAKAQTKPSAIDAKISAIIQKLTLEEKIAMLHANTLFSSAGVKRLGIPDLMSADGPLGIREETLAGWKPANITTDSATFFPNGSALAATWNPDPAYRFGHDMGEEARARNKHIILAPAFNITRTPLNGRTYEYFSEDPLLNTKLAVPFVKGIQSQHVAACVKHFAVNNQEVDRGRVDVEIDERALREIYLPAFKAAVVEGNAWTLMSAYNKVRGEYCSENNYLLHTILKNEWGYKGFVMSDWGGTHSTVDAANKGLDVEMGSGERYDQYFFADKLLAAVKEGKVSMKVIDDKVRRVLWVMYQTSLSSNQPKGKINTPEHSKTVYDIASESIVLLKNEKNMLPLNLSGVKSIAVIGDNATRTFHSGGFGAGVKARYEVTPLAALQKRLGHNVNINFAKGYSGDYRHGGGNVNTETKPANNILIGDAVDIAKKSDLAILFIGGNRDYESESRDRKDLSVPFGEQALVDAVTAANANTIVVVIGGAPYDISSIKKNNHTIVWSWYNGSENGNALADVLLGKINPSGKLPLTFPALINESPAHSDGEEAYPGKNQKVVYKEGILVGYRWYDTKKIEPLYPFGYGLSYTNFEYAGLRTNKKLYKPAETIIVTLNVKNTGNYTGKETVQVYVSKNNSKVERAEKELKAFKKLMVNKGATTAVNITIPVKDFAYFNSESMKWMVEPGEYKISVGSSSRDIRGTTVVSIQ
jgi:beta-glucosidase